jgi:hypothetical protein
VSVARPVVSTFLIVSVLLFIDTEESTLAESAELPDRLPLHAVRIRRQQLLRKEV